MLNLINPSYGSSIEVDVATSKYNKQFFGHEKSSAFNPV